MEVRKNVSLKEYNTFAIEARADFLIEISEEQQLDEFFASEYKDGKYMFIGDGSNLLFVQDYKGCLVKMQTKGITSQKIADNKILVKAKAGEIWDDFVRYCIEKGWNGLENLALIPGKVGSTPVQNIGAYGREVKDFITKVFAYEIATGQRVVFSNEQCKFGYRDSIFKNEKKGRYVITEVEYCLSLNNEVNVQYEDIQKCLQATQQTASPKLVYEIVAQIRRQKLPDVKILGNAGSFFKNPIIPRQQYEELFRQYPLKCYPISDTLCKVPAAQLITLAGWKGYREGSVGVHTNQALVLVNYGGATGQEIKKMAEKIQKDVKKRYHVNIEMEVNLI